MDSLTLDIKNLYPSSYDKYTSENFIFVVTSFAAAGDSNNGSYRTAYCTISINYNNTTGILTVNELGRHIGGTDDVYAKVTGGYLLLI